MANNSRIDYAFLADLDETQVAAALDRIDAKATELANSLNSKFSDIESKGTKSFKALEGAAKSALQTINAEFAAMSSTFDKIQSTVGTKNIGRIVGATGSTPKPVSEEEVAVRVQQELQRLQQEITRSKKEEVILSKEELGIERSLIQISQENAKLEAEASKADIQQQKALQENQRLLQQAQKTRQEELRTVQEQLKIERQKQQLASQYLAELSALKQQDIRTEQEQEKLKREGIATKQKELQLEQQLQAAKERTKVAAQATLQQEIARFPQVRAALDGLVKKYGEFNVVLGRNQAELSKEEKEVLDLIAKYPQLAGRIDALTKEYGELNLELKKTDVANKQTGKSALGFAAQLTGIVSASYLVTNALRTMAREGVQALKSMIQESVVTAQQFDLLRISLRGILETDDAERIERLFTTIRETSRRVGTNASAIANAFLPLLDSTEQLDQVAEAVQELTFLSVVSGRRQTQGDAIRAISEAFSGDFISIRRLYELTPGEIDKIRDSYREAGSEGFLGALDEVLSKRGISIDEFADTTVFKLSQIQEAARDVQGAFGEPIDEALFEILNRISTFVDNNFDDILALGEALGSLTAELIADVSGGLLDALEGVDFDNIFEQFNEFQEFTQNVKEFLGVIQSLIDFFGEAGDGINNFADDVDSLNAKVGGDNAALNELSSVLRAISEIDITDVLISFTAFGRVLETISIAIAGLPLSDLLSAENLNDSWETFIKLILIAAAAIDSQFARIAEGFRSIDDLITGRLTAQEILARQAQAAETAFNKTIEDGIERYLSQTDAIKERNAAIEETRSGTAEGQTQEDIDLFEAEQLPERISKILAEANELQKGINEDLLEAEIDTQRKRLEIRKDYIEKQFDLELDFSRDREDIEIDYLRKLEDLTIDSAKDRRDIGTDYNRSVEDINRELNQDLTDLSKESANDRIDIERDLQAKLAEMRREFLFDAEEAIRQNDAVAFLRLQRKYEFEINEAKLAAEEERKSVVDEEKQKQDELRAEREQEIAEARIDRDRDLEDYKQNIADQLREIQIGRQRDLQDQALAEKRKYEELNIWLDRQTEALNQAHEEKLEDLERKNADELAKIAELNAERLALENRGFVLTLQQQSAFYRQSLGLAAKYKRDMQTFLATSGYGQIPGGESKTNPNIRRTDRGNRPSAETIAKNVIDLAESKGELTELLEQRVRTLLNGNDVNGLLSLFENVKALQFGGSVRANESVIVGDGGEPEIFTPDRSGTVTPMSDVGSLLGSYLNRNQNGIYLPPPNTGSVDNSSNYNVDLSMLDPSTLSPAQIAMITEIVKVVLYQATAN